MHHQTDGSLVDLSIDILRLGGHCFAPGVGEFFGQNEYSPWLKEKI